MRAVAEAQMMWPAAAPFVGSLKHSRVAIGGREKDYHPLPLFELLSTQTKIAAKVPAESLNGRVQTKHLFKHGCRGPMAGQ